MSNFTSAIRGKIVSGNNKYVKHQEKRATVIQGNESENRCVISAINRDGIVQVFYNVPVLYTSNDASNVSWFPENGEEVLITEKNKGYIITGPIIERPNVALEYDIYSNGSSEDPGANMQ